MNINPGLAIRLAVVLLSLSLSHTLRAGSAVAPLPRSTPESQGISSEAISRFIEAIDRIDTMNSFMLVRRGKVVSEGWWTPYSPEGNHELYSLSKSFTSTAVGMAIAEGKLSLSDEVLKFFPDQAPANPSANLKSMRIQDLLTMSAGHQDETETAPDKISVKAFLAHPVPHKPGTHFKYNTPATFMLSAIVQKVTGQTVRDYLQPRLFEPLGISHPVWNTNWEGIALGGYGLRVTTEDIAKFGQLYLQRGQWHGKQLIPSNWVDMATSKQMSNGSNPKSDWDQGYGFQFWRCKSGGYRGDGAFGQYCIVLPAHDVVIAITSGVKDMQAILDLVWTQLLPAFQPRALSSNRKAESALRDRLSHLSVRTAEGSASSPWIAKASGKVYRFPENPQKLQSISLSPSSQEKDALTVVIKKEGEEIRFDAGHHRWINSRGDWESYVQEPTAASAAWPDENTLLIKRCLSETPYLTTLRFHFNGDEVEYQAETNVGFKATKSPALTAKSR